MPWRLITFIEIPRRTGVHPKVSMQPFYYHKSDSFLERLVANVVINLVFFAALAAGLFLWISFLLTSDISWIAELRNVDGSFKEGPRYWVVQFGPILAWSQICSFSLKKILQRVLARKRISKKI